MGFDFDTTGASIVQGNGSGIELRDGRGRGCGTGLLFCVDPCRLSLTPESGVPTAVSRFATREVGHLCVSGAQRNDHF